VFIIAEIGINHMGDMWSAKELIKAAKENGADAVKFQLYDPEQIFTDADLIKEGKKCMLTHDNWIELYDYATNYIRIDCFASVFDDERLSWCEDVGVKYHKIASRVTKRNPELANKILDIGKETFISTGMGISKKLNHPGRENIHFMVCISKYPADIKSYLHKFDRIKKLRAISDHTIGIDFALYCIAHGVTIIEKHFTLDKTLSGSDHLCSMTPSELYMLRKYGERMFNIFRIQKDKS